jgi:hypothetical protein
LREVNNDEFLAQFGFPNREWVFGFGPVAVLGDAATVALAEVADIGG